MVLGDLGCLLRCIWVYSWKEDNLGRWNGKRTKSDFLGISVLSFMNKCIFGMSVILEP